MRVYNYKYKYFIKLDQLDPGIADQLGKALLF